MFSISRTDSDDPHFIKLVASLDAELAVRDGADHGFYSQYNKIDNIRHAVVLYSEGRPVACGAFKEYSADAVEVKRMFTQPDFRGKGAARAVLAELERWAAELSYSRCVLETGMKQPEAIGLYRQSGYVRIPNYGQYAGIDNSVCFEKTLNGSLKQHQE